MKYNYTNIEEMEFETLSKDLLRRYTGVEFRIFAKGIDGGIDGRYETDNEKVIFQSKHYLKTGFNGLYNNLKNIELEKVKKLSPTRYIFLTTLDLTPSNIDKIFDLFQPYIKNKQDIIGQKKIDELLDENKEIILRYPNLWYGYEIIKEVLGDNIYTHYQDKVEKLKKNSEVFVWCDQYNDALKKIEKDNILVITGAPGVGKSTLANILCLEYLVKGYEVYDGSFEELDEIYSIIRRNIDDQNIFILLDDFLGHIILDYFKGNSNGNTLLSIIKKIKNNQNIKLIATSRTYILNEANEKSEKFKELNLDSNRIKKIIEIEEYSIREKALILYKHLKKSKIKKEYVSEIIKNKVYLDIIKHKNYSPRIIEYITNYEYEENIMNSYSEYILENLNKPMTLWEKSFQNLENNLKILLLIICSFRREVLKEKLENAYYKNGELNDKIGSFNINLKILYGSFIKLENKHQKIYVDVVNPSLRDFFSVKINEEKNMYQKIIEYALDIEQIEYIQELREDKEEYIKYILKNNILKRFSKKSQINFYKKNLKKNYVKTIHILIEKKLFSFFTENNDKKIEVIENDVKIIKQRNIEINYLVEIKQLNLLLKENTLKIESMILEAVEEGDIEDIYDIDILNNLISILLDLNKINDYIEVLKEKIDELIEIEIDYIDYDYNFNYDYSCFIQRCIDSVFGLGFDMIPNEIFTEQEIIEKISNKIGNLEEQHTKLYIKNSTYENENKNKDHRCINYNEINNLFENLI